MRETQEAVRRALRPVPDADQSPALSHDRLGRILKLAAYAARDHAIGARTVAFSSLDSAIKIRAISNAVSTGVGRIDLATPDSVMQQPAESPADKSVDKSNRRLAAAGGANDYPEIV